MRATEIQMGDRSTVIVPNSQFISQTVRNVTMGNALGVVGVNLTLPLDTDAMKVRELLLQAFAEHPAILDAPAPSVTFRISPATAWCSTPAASSTARVRWPARAATCSSPSSTACAARHRAVLAAEPADDQDGGPASAAPAPATPD